MKRFSIGCLFLIGYILGVFITNYFKGDWLYIVGYGVFVFLMIFWDKFSDFFMLVFYTAFFIILPMKWGYNPSKYIGLEIVFYFLLLHLYFDKFFEYKRPIFVEVGDVTKFPVETEQSL